MIILVIYGLKAYATLLISTVGAKLIQPRWRKTLTMHASHKHSGKALALLKQPYTGTMLGEVVVSPPFVFLSLVKSLLRSDFYVAAQNCWVRKGGAFTGEISAEMLVNLGIPWVILGHSERRLLLGESNEFVADKVAYALSQGIKVIACVGETHEQRESGSTLDVVASQTKAIAEKVLHWNNIVIAYEPVWAIGTGKVATPVQAQEVHSSLRKWFLENVGADVSESIRIVYGGSVNATNCRELAAQPDVDGFLVGGASLKSEFVDIIQSAVIKTAV